MSRGQLARDLRAAAEGFDRIIEQRAADLAAPMIEAVTEDAAARLADAAGEIQRRDDLIAELRRIVAGRDRQLGRWREVTGCQSAMDYALTHGALTAPGGPVVTAGPREEQAAAELQRCRGLIMMVLARSLGGRLTFTAAEQRLREAADLYAIAEMHNHHSGELTVRVVAVPATPSTAAPEIVHDHARALDT